MKTMKIKQVNGKDLKSGMHLETWFGTQRIARIDPYTGPFTFVCGIMIFPDGKGMSIETNSKYDVIEDELV